MTRDEIERELEQARDRRDATKRGRERLRKIAKWFRTVGLKVVANGLEKRAKKLEREHSEAVEKIGRLRDELKKFGDAPDWLPEGMAELWAKPWTVSTDPAQAADFKRLLWDHGLLSPNFTRREAGGKLRHPQGCDVPESLRGNAQRHAFCLERSRHDLGDRAMGCGSWYRCPPHNSAVGGAQFSQHLNANATDWFEAERGRLGGEKFDQAMEKVFSGGGRGYQSVVGGPIRHVDNGPARTWVYA